jgi:putative colanic acid biosynthesis acetyltransferase WcaB
MSKFIDYIFQDWQANNETSSKSRLVLLLFRIAQLSGNLSSFLYPISIAYRLIYIFIVDWLLGIDIPWDTQIGKNIKLIHGQSIVVNHEAIIGDNCILRTCTTIGNKKLTDGSYSNSPKIGNNVDIGANVVIIGEIIISDNVVIGAGSVVVKDVPPNTIVAGNPAKVIKMQDNNSTKLIALDSF